VSLHIVVLKYLLGLLCYLPTFDLLVTLVFLPLSLIRSRIADQPFSPLTQSYQKCRKSVWDVLTDQAGIAIGNMQLVLPMAVLLLVLSVFLFKRALDIAEDEKYSKADKADALNALACAMLVLKEDMLDGGEGQDGGGGGAGQPAGGPETGTEGQLSTIEGLVRDLNLRTAPAPPAVSMLTSPSAPPVKGPVRVQPV